MSITFTPSERTIMNIKDKAMLLEQERLKAYDARLSELVVEIAQWHLKSEEYPMKLAQYAFKLGFECGANKMYSYL